MGNQTRGIVDVAAGDGKTVRLQFTANAMCEVEDKTGQGFLEFLAEFEKASAVGKLRTATLRLLVWGGMIEHQPEATLHDAGRLIEAMGGLTGAADYLGQAIMSALPAPDAAGVGDAGNAKAA